MRSIMKQDPKLSPAYCQQTETNEGICSVMSAALLREFGSKRFQRNRPLESVVTERHEIQQAEVKISRLTTRSQRGMPSLVVTMCEGEDDDRFEEALMLTACGAGLTIANIKIRNIVSLDQVRAALSFVMNLNPADSIYLLLENRRWLMEIFGQGLLPTNDKVAGLIIFDTDGKDRQRLSMDLGVPTLILSNQASTLLETKNQPSSIILTLPSEVKDAVRDTNLYKLIREDHLVLEWTCRSVVEFVEAVRMRLQFGEKKHLSRL